MTYQATEEAAPHGRLVQIRTWVSGSSVTMLTAWTANQETITRYVLQSYRGGVWFVVRSWAPADDEAATLLARVTLRQGEVLG